MRPIFNVTYKGENRSKNTYEIYIINWYYYYKVGIVFAMYQRMRLKGGIGMDHVTGNIWFQKL